LSTGKEWTTEETSGVGSDQNDESLDSIFEEESSTFFEQNLSLAEEVSMEILEYELKLDDELLSEIGKRNEAILSTFQGKKPIPESDLKEEEQEPNQLKLVLERNQKLENYW